MQNSTKKYSEYQTLTTLSAVAPWIALFLTIIGNFLITIMLIPAYVVMNTVQTSITLFLIGTGFGALIVWLLKRILRQEHIIIWLFLPAISLITVYIIATLSNPLALAYRIPQGFHNPFILSIAYTSGIMTPAVIWKIKKILKK